MHIPAVVQRAEKRSTLAGPNTIAARQLENFIPLTDPFTLDTAARRSHLKIMKFSPEIEKFCVELFLCFFFVPTKRQIKLFTAR